MFRIENGKVWYKSNDMITEIRYGNEQIAEPCGNNQYCVKRFVLSSGNYEVDSLITAYNFNGTDYVVADGYFTVIPTPEPIPEPTAQDLVNADVLLAQAEQTSKLNSIDETLAVILINSAGGVL